MSIVYNKLGNINLYSCDEFRVSMFHPLFRIAFTMYVAIIYSIVYKANCESQIAVYRILNRFLCLFCFQLKNNRIKLVHLPEIILIGIKLTLADLFAWCLS